MTTSIRVLLVDSDPESLHLMTDLMTPVSYQVTSYENGYEAFAFLMKSKHKIDLLIWNFHVPENNGLTIVKEPLIIMCHDHKMEPMMKSTKCNACDFLVKPMSKEILAVLWRHIYRKRISKDGGLGQYNNDLYQSNNQEASKNVEDSEERNISDQKGDQYKKPRMNWTAELHQKFEMAVEKTGGVNKAVPKEILKYMQEEMNVQGVTRNNVASHLQKYRLNLEKTREDSGWRNAGPQAAANAPIQCPSTNHLTMNNSNFMTNPFANLPHSDSFHQPQQQQDHQQLYNNISSLQPPSVITKQDSAYESADMDIPELINNQNSHYIDISEYFLPGFKNFDPA